ncbi:YDG domain-containing protein, partial [Candidatus Symbiothrix dinenymphae]
LGGTEKDNYELMAQPADVVATAAITPKPVTLTGFSVDSRTYDGTTNATFSGTGNIVGIVEDVGDVVTVEKGTAAFADKNAGPDKPVIFDGFALAGAHKDNYELAAQPVATATITPLPVVVTPGDNLSKTYNTDDPPELTYTWSPELLDGDIFSGVLSRTSNEKPGTYPITQGSLTAGGNYAISIANKVFTIIPKSITAST